MPHHLPPLPCTAILAFLVGISLSTVGNKYAQAQSPPSNVVYSASQPSRTWNTRPGGLTFEGKALRREGDYVAFETTRKLHIWLPLRYLSNQGQTYLDALGAASSPLTLDVTRPQVDTGPGGFGAPAGMLDPNPSRPGAGSPDTPAATSPDAASTNPDTTVAMPAKDADAENESSTDPPSEDATSTPQNEPQTYEPRQMVEVRVNDQWFKGQVFAQNPAQQKYFVSYRVDNAPRSGWFEVADMRAVKEDEESDEAGQDAINAED